MANAQAKAQAQAIAEARNEGYALAQAQARQELKTMTALDVMLSAVPDLTDSEGNKVIVAVGEKVIEDETLRKVTVSARTIQAFSRVSNVAVSVELGQVTKELAKKEGFSSVKRFVSLALPELSDSRIMELYTVGRLFGDPETHKWKYPIPEKATITNLSQVAKAFCNTKKLDEATLEDIHERFAVFVRDYLDTGLLTLDDTLSDLRKTIHDIQNPAIDTTFEEQGEGKGEGTGEGTGEGQPEKVEGEQVNALDEARKAFDVLMKFFKGNDEATDALSVALALLPKDEQPEAQDEQPEA